MKEDEEVERVKREKKRKVGEWRMRRSKKFRTQWTEERKGRQKKSRCKRWRMTRRRGGTGGEDKADE